MNAMLDDREPYRLSAGVLALTMHVIFFLMLYLGVRWQSHPHAPEALQVEMWDSLPNGAVEPVRERAPAAEPVARTKAKPAVLPPSKADIEMRDRKRRKAREEERKAKAAAKAKREAEEKELAAYAEKIRQAEQARVRAEVNAAIQTQVDRYQDMIRNKIRRKMRLVADVPDTAEAIFKVTLLPDGSLMDDPVLVKSSGYPAYDDAAERAIRAAEPLPVPEDVSLQKMFRVLNLSIKP